MQGFGGGGFKEVTWVHLTLDTGCWIVTVFRNTEEFFQEAVRMKMCTELQVEL
jgi:hypothetical protein